MISFKQAIRYFTIFERVLWLSSAGLILVSFFIFDRVNYFNLILSLLGVTSLIFIAKGNPIGHMIMIVFAIMYGLVSLGFRYYGEMITYVGMSLPMAIISLVSWIKNPYKGSFSQVKIDKMGKKEIVFMFALAVVVTAVFYFILKSLNTANLVFSTISVTTSFIAAYLTFRRNPFYAFAYALNDIVLIVLWILAGVSDVSYLSVTVCFVAFLFNDIYGFISWQRMKKRQEFKF